MLSTIVSLSFLVQFIFLGYECREKELTYFEKLDQAYKCDSNCWFVDNELNSNTITKWPVNCTEVCGTMYFTANSDVPSFELKEYFKNLKVMKGAISFSNTEYVNVEFLSNLKQVYCNDSWGFTFNYNRNLEVLNFGNLTNITCEVSIYKNNLLDATDFCQKYESMTLMNVFDNYKNCKGCIVKTQLHPSDLSQYKGCPTLINTMWFGSFYADHYPPDVMSPLNDVETINGCLIFSETDLQNFSFFQKLETIRLCDNTNSYDLVISQCYQLTRFDMPSLKTIKSKRDNFLINVEKVHNDFCFTTSEMHFFLENDVVFGNIEAKYCQNETNEMACVFDKMSSLESNCTGILGNVIVNSGDEVHVDKLKNVKNIYGSLLIQNTSLTDLSFFGNLEYLALLNDSSVALQINSNKQLRNVSFPNLKRVLSLSHYQISFKENGNQFLNSSACLHLMEKLFLTKVRFDGRECEVIDRANAVNNPANRISKVFKVVLTLKIVHFQQLFQ